MLLGTIITETVIKQIQEAPFFSIIADEVQDISSIEQVALILRYVHMVQDENKFAIEEKFITFSELHREMTGEAIAKIILESLKNLGLDCQFLRGQGYDGSGSMAGSVRGASSVVLREHHLALFVHCCSHVLNLAIANSCSLPLVVRNMIGSVSEVSKFLKHAKKRDNLEEVIEGGFKESKKKRVKPLCSTWWLEWYDAFEVFLELYPAILCALSDIAHKEDSVPWNNDTVRDANGLLATVEKFPFLLTLVVVLQHYKLHQRSHHTSPNAIAGYCAGNGNGW